jgi:hypothetical protein
MTKIEGVPEGWELVGFRTVRRDDFIISGDGKPYKFTGGSGGVHAIIRKK